MVWRGPRQVLMVLALSLCLKCYSIAAVTAHVRWRRGQALSDFEIRLLCLLEGERRRE